MAKVLVLGAGMVGSAIVRDVAERHEVLATDVRGDALAALSSVANVRTRQLDCADAAALRAAAAAADAVVCAVPGWLGFRTLTTLVEAGAKVADISFFAEDALALDARAKQTGAVVVTDIGVAPGIDNLVLGYHDARMQVRRFECLVGGLPIARTLPYQYKAPFSPADVIEEYLRPARMVENGRVVTKPALSEPGYVDFPGIGTLEAFHTDGLRSLISTMPHVPDMVERTLRYPGHRELMLALREGGFFSDEPVDVDGVPVRPRAFTSRLLFDAWKLRPGEPELTVLRVTIEGVEDGELVRHVYHLDDRGDAASQTSSMARTTGYTCTGMLECLLDGTWTQRGVTPPERVGRVEGLWPKIRAHLAERRVTLVHTTQ
ncbi:MAG TPA: saccharopine dehydrogenase C-terminal domain-containing protein [Planctomycetota bacterium]|nr:saccharopine dehydrogenase C-terminal domain-containing protein [Planctomycetota bacterium]